MLVHAARSPQARTPTQSGLEPAAGLHALLSSCDGDADPLKARASPAGYARRALFATTSRLLACLVNESLVDAFYVGPGTGGVPSHLLVLPRGSSPGASRSRGSIAVQLRHKPVLDRPLAGQEASALPQVRLLDPEDIGMGQWIQSEGAGTMAPVADAGQIMRLVGQWNAYSQASVAALCSELASSTSHQAHAYMHRRPDPDIKTSKAIEWEQSIVEGHATHPMHRARHAEPPLAPVDPNTELNQLHLAFVAVPRSEMKVEGGFEECLSPIYRYAQPTGDCASARSSILDHVDRALELVMPVHPLHVPAVLAMFGFARLLPFSLPADAQLSLRTVVPELPVPFSFNLKLPLGIKTSSALRTVSPWSAFVGPRVTQAIPHILRGAPVEGALLVAGEPASAVSADPDFDIAKYLCCVVRQDAEHLCRSRGERVIVAAALTDYSDDGVGAAVRHWKLETLAERQAFLQSYADRLFDAFLPPILNHGFAFEAHPQNTLLRVDASTGEVRGFVVRDFGGIKVHRPTFRASTGADIEMLPDSCTEAHTMDEVFDLAHHTLVQCQLHRLIRVLGLHYCGGGWAIVRSSFERRVPSDHPLRLAWYQATFELKCFVSMKLDGLYRHYTYHKVPNVLFYKNEDEGVVFAPDKHN